MRDEAVMRMERSQRASRLALFRAVSRFEREVRRLSRSVAPVRAARYFGDGRRGPERLAANDR